MRWVTFCRALCVSEASIATLLNVYMLFTLWKRRIDSNASTYRIGITVVCLSAIGQSLLECFAIVTHQIHDNEFTLILLGPVEFIGEGIREFLAEATLIFAFFMWEWIPASCILQCLALCRPHYSKTRRLMIAYGYCLAIICPIARSFINEKTWQPHVHAIVREIQGIDSGETVYAYASTTKEIAENNFRTVMPFVLIGFLPSYAWSYGAFIVTTILISKALRAYGTQLSKRTMTMQKRFLRMLIIQGFVPLAITGVPASIFIGTLILGASMDRWSILHTTAIHVVPIVQALVSFSFIHRLKGNSGPPSQSRREAPDPSCPWTTTGHAHAETRI